jgi:hypothetical protein
MEAHQLLIKIDRENEIIFGPITITPMSGSNAYINKLDHRRWMHPEYQKYLDLKKIVKDQISCQNTE